MASSGLNLLSNYDSDNDDSENDVSNHAKVILNQVSTKPKLLPLPNEIKGLFEKESKDLCPGYL